MGYGIIEPVRSGLIPEMQVNMSSQPTTNDAEIILKLYDFRREAVMREARAFIAQFFPKSLDDMLALVNAFGTKEQAYLRQVMGYWEMAASFVNRGALNRELALDNYGEMFFIYAKIEPYLQDVRKAQGMPQLLQGVQQLVESSEETRQRLADMKKRQGEMLRRREAAAAGKS